MHRHWPEDLYNASGLTAAIKGKESSRSDIGKLRAAMNLSDFKQRSQEDYRQLRVVTILAFLLAVCLLLPHGMVAERPFPAIGIAPMFFSAAMGVLIFTGMLRSPKKKAVADLTIAALLFAIMVPSFVALEDNGWRAGAGLTMLGTYGTSTMILNFIIHCYLGAMSIDSIEFPRLVIAWQPNTCAHCNHDHHTVSLPGGATIGLNGPGAGVPHDHATHEAHQPFIDESDEARRDSSDYQTSGFGSPRRSLETLATDANDLERRAGSFEC